MDNYFKQVRLLWCAILKFMGQPNLDYSRDVNNPPLSGRDLVALQRETW